MAVVLALVTALSYGVGDFAGGMAARRASAFSVTATAHAIGFAGLTVVAALVGAERVGVDDLAYGVASGIAGFFGIVLLYHGLARGTMSVVSPVTAVVGAAVPVLVGLTIGERPSGVELVGIAAALTAIALVSSAAPVGRIEPRILGIAVGSGLGFGLFFVLVDRIDEAAGLWPLLAGRGASVALALVMCWGRSQPAVVPRPALGLAAGAGVLDLTANVTFLLASQAGLLAIVGVVASLYPAATVLLALTVTGERVSRVQAVGLGVAAAALVLIAA